MVHCERLAVRQYRMKDNRVTLLRGVKLKIQSAATKSVGRYCAIRGLKGQKKTLFNSVCEEESQKSR